MNRNVWRVMWRVACCAAMMVCIARAVEANVMWAPSERQGPHVLTVAPEKWNGYDSYDGYFWMHHGLRWTRGDLDRFKAFQAQTKVTLEGVYEFRRVRQWDTDAEGSRDAERWDGAWARDGCAWFIVCIPWQEVYTEYATSLPASSNSGVEEYDGWWSQWRLTPPFVSPSWAFDLCDVAAWVGTSEGVCDEEYEISFDPNRLVDGRRYFTAIKFRTDREDGTLPTKWQVEFEAHKRAIIFPSYIYRNYREASCTTDYGMWTMDVEGRTYAEADTERWSSCVDSDGDGLMDRYDACPRVSDPTDNDQDGDGKGDACDDDDDDDGVIDTADAFPLDAMEWRDTDDDGIGNNADDDDDGDGYSDAVEVSAGSDPLSHLSLPADGDGDGIADIVDTDDDDDGMADADDAFPQDPAEWLDTDSDGQGNNADLDDDGDGYIDAVEIQLGTDPLDAASVPPDHDGDLMPDALDPDDDNDGVPDAQDAFPFSPVESMDTDGDGIGDNADPDDDDDGYDDIVEVSLGTDHLDPSSYPTDNDNDYIPDGMDSDDDNDGVPDTSDAFPFDAAESQDTDGDGIGDNADSDDDDDDMPDTWEITHGLNPLDPNDADADDDGDGRTNLWEYLKGSDPHDDCSPPWVDICFNYYGDGDWGQCGDVTGIHCVPLDTWTPTMEIDTDGRPGGCWQSFSLQSDCAVDLNLCVDFQGDSPGTDLGQCQNAGMHCAAVNQWTDPILLDMDGRGGWCTQEFLLTGSDHFTLQTEFWGDGASGDSNGQCRNTGSSKAFSEYGTGTDVIGLDTDDRGGGCWQRFKLRRGTYSIMAF